MNVLLLTATCYERLDFCGGNFCLVFLVFSFLFSLFSVRGLWCFSEEEKVVSGLLFLRLKKNRIVVGFLDILTVVDVEVMTHIGCFVVFPFFSFAFLILFACW